MSHLFKHYEDSKIKSQKAALKPVKVQTNEKKWPKGIFLQALLTRFRFLFVGLLLDDSFKDGGSL
jgi:hypothetical protein